MMRTGCIFKLHTQWAVRLFVGYLLLTIEGCGPLLSVPCARPEPAKIVQPPAPVKCAPAAYADVVSMPMNKCGEGLCFDRENAQKLVAKIKALEACH